MDAWNEYLAKLSLKQREIVKKVLKLAIKIAPDAKIEMTYGVPDLKINKKPLIAVVAFKNHFGVYPFSPEVIKALNPLLGDLETAQGTIRFSYDDFPSDELIRKLIKLRSKEIL